VTGLTEQEREALWDADESCGCIGVADRVIDAVERILTARLAAHEAREAELIAALEAGDACGAVGCRALAERDALLAQEARVRALADEFAGSGLGTDFFGNPLIGWVPVDRIRAALDGPPA